MGGRVTYALGYTGLGVGASRWAGGVVRDMLLRPMRTGCGSAAIDVVRSELDRADRNEGRRGPILQLLDALGIGFDS
jgi:hypothetical protein